jgi:hypothetical protein
MVTYTRYPLLRDSEATYLGLMAIPEQTNYTPIPMGDRIDGNNFVQDMFIPNFSQPAANQRISNGQSSLAEPSLAAPASLEIA